MKVRMLCNPKESYGLQVEW